ncbi:MAG: DUF1559 domain-containing protein [Planctomycetales bacterium]|nr:DUF1559 domain-containing protein [Planctomycetales bacterium]
MQGKGGDLRGFAWWGGGAHFETLLTPNSPLPDRPPQNCTPSNPLNPPCINSGTSGIPDEDETIAARSRHTGGVMSAHCDGSVRFYSQNIDLDTWRGLGSAAGGEVVNVD